MNEDHGTSAVSGDEYRLPTVPRRLRRRISAVMLLVAAACGALFIFVITLLSGSRWSAGGWIGVTALVASAVVVVTLTTRWMSPGDRALLDAAQRRTLGPLPRPHRPTPVTVEVRPGVLRRRLLAKMPADATAAASAIVLDELGMSVPGWLVGPQRQSDDQVVRIEWRSVERWRVRADSDGPDLSVLTIDGERERSAGSRSSTRSRCSTRCDHSAG